MVCAGMNKMVINHLERHFVTSDASTLMNELDVEHPAAKLIVLAAKAQEQEIGDGTNFVRFSAAAIPQHIPCASKPTACMYGHAVQVISFAGQLLACAEGLLSDGLHTSEVAQGFSQAGVKVQSQPLSISGVPAPASAWTAVN